jgi:bifunctional oligoribonuclease and PAP phosphatase NrnA
MDPQRGARRPSPLISRATDAFGRYGADHSDLLPCCLGRIGQGSNNKRPLPRILNPVRARYPLTMSALSPPPIPSDVLNLIQNASHVLLTGHVRPDGDCIGAQAGLTRVLEALGKRVTILNPDPPESAFDYLSSEVAYGVYQGDAVPDHDLLVLLDISELERCGDLAAPLKAAPSKKLVIDHHVHHGAIWWDAALVDQSASATGVLVYRLAQALGVELDAVASRGLFTSLVTDTGWFKYSNTDAETLRVAGELVARGVDPSALYMSIFQRNDAGMPHEIGAQLRRLEYFADERLALLTTDGTGEQFEGGSDMLLDILRSVDSIEVVLSLRHTQDGRFKLSARSKRDFNVNALARRFGGGGHIKASGASLDGPFEAARAALVSAALEEIEQQLDAPNKASSGSHSG